MKERNVFFLRRVPQNQDSVNTDTVCRLYEVGRQRLAEEEEEDEEDQVPTLSFFDSGVAPTPLSVSNLTVFLRRQEDDEQDEDDDDDDDSDDDDVDDTDPLIAELENGGEDDDEDGNDELSPSDEEVSRLLEDEDDSDNDDGDQDGDNGELFFSL